MFKFSEHSLKASKKASSFFLRDMRESCKDRYTFTLTEGETTLNIVDTRDVYSFALTQKELDDYLGLASESTSMKKMGRKLCRLLNKLSRQHPELIVHFESKDKKEMLALAAFLSDDPPSGWEKVAKLFGGLLLGYGATEVIMQIAFLTGTLDLSALPEDALQKLKEQVETALEE